MGPPLVTRQVSNLLVVHFIGRLSLETKPRPKRWPTLSIVNCLGLVCLIVKRCRSGLCGTR